MTVDPTKIKAQGIDLTTTVSADSGNALTTDSGDLLKVPTTNAVVSAGTTPITNGGIYTALGNRTAIVTDNAPTSGSGNFCTSGTIYTAIQNSISPFVVTKVHHEAVTGTVNGTNKVFTIGSTPLNNKVDIFVGKSAYIQDIDYTVATTTITFTQAPQLLSDGSTPSIRASYWKQADVSTNPPAPSLAYLDASLYTPTYTADPTAWDTSPTENSTKPVTSDGIYTVLNNMSISNLEGWAYIGKLLVQWGRTSATVEASAYAEGDLNVTFTKAFTKTPIVQLTPGDVSGNVGEYTSVTYLSTTKFEGKIGHTASASSATVYAYWIAIGAG